MVISSVVGLAGGDIIRSVVVADVVASVDEAVRRTIGAALEADDLSHGHIAPPVERTTELELAFSNDFQTLGADRVSVWNRQHWRVFALAPENAQPVGATPQWAPGSAAFEQALSTGETSFEVQTRSDGVGERLAVVVPVGASSIRSRSASDLVVGAVEIEVAYEPIQNIINTRIRVLWGALVVLSLFSVVVAVARQARADERTREPSMVTLVMFDSESGGLRHVVAGDGWLAPIVDSNTPPGDLAWWNDLVLDDRVADTTDVIDVRGQEELV